ncbi:helix-turn-helix domain-containing protein [Actinomadura opuntiae]|uniref:helix-turn-helix domain-containing protein n=1 Tax=Actinomadura sp. OS1-43 TaxID=604315 RepID=UPI00255A9A1C|nr:helix-turn-helix transcriptional regulator [Actinomadura sp. OS1-43]MDL4815093.1 helix-turn-helix transcriptional regulator [Actinomadura sp. OS1-43]
MARRERPLDPADGPLEAFAHDLRELRAAAGEPTYRQLAQLAGYSASTLSEAASGARLPTLAVTLAFVGACSGDTEAWEHRWKEVHDALQSMDDAPPPGAPDEGAGSLATQEIMRADLPDGGPAAPHRVRPVVIGPVATGGRAKRNIAAITAGCLLVAGLLVVGLNGPWRGGEAKESSGCPSMPKNPKFTATAYGDGVPVRSGAALAHPPLATYPAGCVLGFTGFCIGQKVTDRTAGIPDSRWFVLPDGHVVPSALVHGNPPTQLAPASCADARPAPKRISLKAVGPPSPDPRVVLSASGPQVQIAGFAAYYAADPGSPDLRLWHQIGLTGDSDPALSVAWRPDKLPAPVHAGDTVLVVAVACLGGGDSGRAASLASLKLPGKRDRASLTPRSATVDQAARRAACQYPSAS